MQAGMSNHRQAGTYRKSGNSRGRLGGRSVSTDALRTTNPALEGVRDFVVQHAGASLQKQVSSSLGVQPIRCFLTIRLLTDVVDRKFDERAGKGFA
jgi:hypothetical protein